MQPIISDPGDEQNHIHETVPMIYGTKGELDPVGVQQDMFAPPPFVFTADQQSAYDILLPMILERRKKQGVRWVLLEGPAGTGKTTTLNKIMEAARKAEPGLNIGMTAPTHKAVRQLKRNSLMKEDMEFGTIHSFLGLKEVHKPNPKNKNEWIVVYEAEWSPDRTRKIDNVHVLIIDEASMLGDILFDHIDDAMRSMTNLIIIFTGDGRQIPPVQDKSEPVKDAIPFIEAQRSSRRIGHIVLNQIVRQALDNPIIKYATQIRLNYTSQSIAYEPESTEDSGVEVISKSGGIEPIRNLFRKYFDTDEFRKDPDYVKVVAWRNDTVEYFNREIRLILHKAEALPRIVVGDMLIMDKPFLRGQKIVLPNNEEINVMSLEILEVPVKYKMIDRSAFRSTSGDEDDGIKSHSRDFKVYRCTVHTHDKKQFLIDILHEDDEQTFKELIQDTINCANKCEHFDKKTMWKQKFDLEKVFAQVKHNYALTAHKAQGSTYDYCISMEWDINQCWDITTRNRIKYVAATRPRKKLFLIR